MDAKLPFNHLSIVRKVVQVKRNLVDREPLLPAPLKSAIFIKICFILQDFARILCKSSGPRAETPKIFIWLFKRLRNCFNFSHFSEAHHCVCYNLHSIHQSIDRSAPGSMLELARNANGESILELIFDHLGAIFPISRSLSYSTCYYREKHTSILQKLDFAWALVRSFQITIGIFRKFIFNFVLRYVR